jgi:ELWxxDGT repeat protein
MSWLHSFRSLLFGSRVTRRAAKHRPTLGRHVSRPLRVKSLEDRVVPSATLVSDINNYSISSNPANITAVGGQVFFTAVTNSGATELFASNGKASGTVELTFGSRLASFNHLVAFHNKLYFAASDATLGYQALWQSDGTVAGTTPVLASGDAVSVTFPDAVTEAVVGSQLFFMAYDFSLNRYDLWVSNGTSAGTHPVQPGNSATPTPFNFFTNVNGTLFFEAYDSGTGKYTLWTSNGTAAGTSMVTELTSFQIVNDVAVGSEYYFEMYDSPNLKYALWKSDGTAAGTVMVGDVTGSIFYSMTAFNGNLFFQAPDTTDAPLSGYALWTSNGTTVGPFKFGGGVTPVQTNSTTQVIVSGSLMYFVGDDSTHGYSVWETDGVAANNKTATVQASGSTPFNTNPTQLALVGTELYFVAQNSNDALNYDLWKTDGTSANTVVVQTTGFARGILDLTGGSTQVFFDAEDLDANGNTPHGFELWASDSTSTGTAMVLDINTITGSSNPQNLVAAGNEIFFNATTFAPINGTAMWQSDGTAANTAPVETSTGIVPGTPQNFTAVGNTLFFTANDANGDTLWTTGPGLKSAVDIFAGLTNKFNSQFASTDGTGFADLNGILYFGAYNPNRSTWALWQSNGTAAGTKVVSNLVSNYAPQDLTVVGSDLFWENYDPANSTYALWEYNGTLSQRLMDISTNGLSNLTAVGSNVFFQAYDSTASKYALWTSNGATTTQLADISGNALSQLIAFNGNLYFGAYSTSLGYWQLWSSNGTTAGTVPFLNGAGTPVPLAAYPYFTVMGTKLFYEDYDLAGVNLLGATDGTAAGTYTVQAGTTGTLALSPTYLVNDNGILAFQAYDSVHGFELWQSDGTANGTLLAADINAGSFSSSPQYLTVAGSLLYFSAFEPVHGTELWEAQLAPNVVTAGLSGPTDGVTEQHRPFVLTATDSNAANNAAGFSWTITWGDGTPETISGQSGLTADHQYATVGNYTVSVTATNLADGATSSAVTLVDSITLTEVQGGNLALGGKAGNDAWTITPGTKAGSFTVTDNGKNVIKNFKPASGEQIFLYGGNGTNTIAVTDSGTTSDTFTLGTGYVIFNKGTFVPQVPAAWTINTSGSTGNNVFNINGVITASITAGGGNDSFIVASGASLGGTIDGGAGTNSLSYSTYMTSGVVVNLLLGEATAIDSGASGGIAHIENVTGSAVGGDILVGDANVNALATVAGHNIVIAGSGGGDTLSSHAADILIAGTTNYDTNLPALQFILAEWQASNSTNYATVINNIETSATDPLNATTVSDSGTNDQPSTLNGNGQPTSDWFFLHNTGGTTANDTLNNAGTGDTQTSI